MKKSLLVKISCLFLVLITTLFSYVYFAAPTAITRVLTQAMADFCESCTVRWESAGLIFFPPGIKVTNFELLWGDPLTTQVEASISSIQAEIALSDLLGAETVINKISINRPRVVLIEGDKRKPYKPRSPKTASRPIHIQSIELTNGDFIYRRVQLGKIGKKRVGQIHVSDINASARTPPAQVDLTAVFETTGKVKIKLLFADLDKPSNVDISLSINALTMSEANAYFREADGITFSGTLVQGQSAVALRGTHLTSWVRARYNGLKLKFFKDEDRGALVAKAYTLYTKLKIQNDRLDEQMSVPGKLVHAELEQGESVMHFIFRGLKEAALVEAKK